MSKPSKLRIVRNCYCSTVKGVFHTFGKVGEISRDEAQSLLDRKKLDAERASREGTVAYHLTILLESVKKAITRIDFYKGKPENHKTYQIYSRYIGQFIEMWGHLTPRELNHDHFLDFLMKNENWHNARKTVVQSLSKIFVYLEDCKLLRDDFRKRELRKKLNVLVEQRYQKKFKYISEQDFADIERICQHEGLSDLLAYVTILWLAGLRPAECEKLRVKHYRRDRAVIELDRREFSPRKDPKIIRLCSKAIALIDSRIVGLTPESPIFTTAKGRIWNHPTRKVAMEKLSRRFGRTLSVYQFRKGFVTRLCKNPKLNPQTVQKLARHSSFAMTDTYYNMIDKDNEYMTNAIEIANNSPT